MKTIITFFCVLCIISCATDDTVLEPEVVEEEEMEVEGEANLVFEGDVELVTQQEVEEFASVGYTEITGNFILSRQFENPDPITSLSNLSTLEVIGGDLILNYTYEITSLDGFQNLTSVSGALKLLVNFNITSLEVFSGVNSTVASLEIVNLRGLETLQGLEGISIASGGDLIIEGNDSLLNLDAIQDGIPSVMDVIKFKEFSYECGPFISCDQFPPEFQPFTSLAFLSNVTEVEWLRIKGFQGTSLSGLENITSVNRLTVWTAPNLINLQEFSNITSNLLGLFITDALVIESLDGLENIATISNSLNVVGNLSLTDFCALENSISNLSDDDILILINSFNPTLQDLIDGNCSE